MGISNQEINEELEGRGEFAIHLIKRVLELHGENEALVKENEYLKRELRARRRQGDTWRKKFNALKKGA